MKRTPMVLLICTISLATTPLFANPMRAAHTSPDTKTDALSLNGKCNINDADGLSAQNKSVTIQWVLKLNSSQPSSPLKLSQAQQEQKLARKQQFYYGSKTLERTLFHVQPPEQNQAQTRDVFNGPIVKITAASAAAASVALILKLMLGKPTCGPKDQTLAPESMQQWTRLKPLKKYKAINTYKPGEVLTCVGCGQQPIEGTGQAGGGFDDQYRGDASTDASSPTASSTFRGRSMTGYTPAATSRYSSRRTGSTPQLATPTTRVNLGRSAVGKR